MWAPLTDKTRTVNALTSAGAHPRYSALGSVSAFVPEFGGAVQYEAIARPDDDERATADTIAIMRRMVIEDSQAPAIRAAASAAAGNGGDPIAGIHSWVRRHVTFREDAEPAAALAGFNPAETEVLIRPVDLLRMPQPAGDCDDFSMLTAAMLRAVGIPAAFVTIAADPSSPDTYSHVYVLAAGRIPVDSSHGPRAGWSAPAAGKSRTWEIDAPMFTRTLGDTNLWDVWGTTPQETYPDLGPINYPTPTTSNPLWGELAMIGAKAGADIARMQGTPTGYYQQTGPGGSVTTRQAGNMPFSVPNLSAGGGSWLLIGGVGIVALLMLAKKGN